jgi:hypothetical protein
MNSPREKGRRIRAINCIADIMVYECVVSEEVELIWLMKRCW